MELLVSIENFEEDGQARIINSPRTLGMLIILIYYYYIYILIML